LTDEVNDTATLVIEHGDKPLLPDELPTVLATHGYVVPSERPSVYRQIDPAAGRRELDALDRLFKVASRDTHQSKQVADFLLAWWNADRDGGFDLTSLWSLDTAICEDLAIVFNLIASSHSYPDAFGYDTAIRRLVEQWRQPDPN
jgi:hypothetical protein